MPKLIYNNNNNIYTAECVSIIGKYGQQNIIYPGKYIRDTGPEERLQLFVVVFLCVFSFNLG